MDNQPSEQERRFLGLHRPRREKSSDRRNQSDRLSLPRREKNNDERNCSRDRGTTKSPIPPKQRKKVGLSEKSGCKRTDLWSQAYSKVQQENPKLLVAFKKYLLAAKSMWNVLFDWCYSHRPRSATPLLWRREISLVLKWLSNCYIKHKDNTLVSRTAMVNALSIAECFCHHSAQCCDYLLIHSKLGSRFGLSDA